VPHRALTLNAPFTRAAGRASEDNRKLPERIAVETTRIKTIEELREVERRYGPNYLFRGQTKHYFDPTGAPDFPTSFERHGCIPPLMFKWTHYAKAIIRAFGDGPYDEINTEVVQAILQHYG
jgi:hypothetical protein